MTLHWLHEIQSRLESIIPPMLCNQYWETPIPSVDREDVNSERILSVYRIASRRPRKKSCLSEFEEQSIQCRQSTWRNLYISHSSIQSMGTVHMIKRVILIVTDWDIGYTSGIKRGFSQVRWPI